jgi:hypothetical protein
MDTYRSKELRKSVATRKYSRREGPKNVEQRKEVYYGLRQIQYA